MKEVMAAVFCILLGTPSLQAAEDLVFVRGRGLVDLDPFACTDITTSNFLRRVCYDEANLYLLIELRDIWHHYCEVDGVIVAAFLNAPSAASFYNSNIRSGPFDCSRKRMPHYE
jgi:KTSC domain